MFLQEIKMNQRENFKNHPPTSPTNSFSTGSCFWLTAMLQVGRLWYHHENWSGASGSTYLHDQNLPFLPVTGRWESGLGNGTWEMVM